MARQSTGRRNAEELDDDLDEVEPDEAESGEAGETARSTDTEELWESVKIDLIEIALPKGVGYTLRAYRLDNEITPTDISEREADVFPDRDRPTRLYVTDEKAIVDDDEDDEPDADVDDEVEDDFDEDDDDVDVDDDLDDEDDEDEDDDLDDESEEDADDEESADEDDEDDDEDEATAVVEPEPEEVPVFLGRQGQLYLFHTPEGLVEYVKSGAEHDLSQLATWPDLVERLSVEDVVPVPEDQYELDLVVDNLRAGHDGWDPELLIQAGEVARDLGYALRLEAVQAALAPGSPLDDLDEAMRSAAGGGIGGFMARRKLKKIGAEAAPLGWRTIIGKISAVVDWRD